jgi:hypothetical protein
MAKSSFQAKKYVNRKGEAKMQVSGSQEAFKELLKGTDATNQEFEAALKAAIAAK